MKHVSSEQFYTGVDRIKIERGGSFFVATPWRALADLMYTGRRSWKNIIEIEADLRIDIETLINSDTEMLTLLAENYPSNRVRENLKKFLKEIVKFSKG